MTNTAAECGCFATLALSRDRVKHFVQRFAEKGLKTDEAVIVILNADDVYGGPLAKLLLPNSNWQEIRDRGEVPFARGLVGREGIQQALELFDPIAAEILANSKDKIALVVVD